MLFPTCYPSWSRRSPALILVTSSGIKVGVLMVNSTTCLLMLLIIWTPGSSQTILSCPSPSQPSYFNFWDCYVSFPYIYMICLITSSWPLSWSALNNLVQMFMGLGAHNGRLIHSLKLIVLIVGLMKDKATKAMLGVTCFEYNQNAGPTFSKGKPWHLVKLVLKELSSI